MQELSVGFYPKSLEFEVFCPSTDIRPYFVKYSLVGQMITSLIRPPPHTQTLTAGETGRGLCERSLDFRVYDQTDDVVH